MRLDFSSLPFKNRAFSRRPMTFMDPEVKNFLSAIIDLVAVETGNRVAREFWQQKQLQNLVAHGAERSAIWRRRIGTAKVAGIRLTDLPFQTRTDVVEQVTKEGTLARANEAGASIKHSTSGSSGVPVEFFVTERNTVFNLVRSITQYFLEGADFSMNVTRIRPKRMAVPHGFTARKEDDWVGPLEPLLRSGSYKHVEYFHPDMKALCEELLRDRLGHVIAMSQSFELLLQHAGPEFFKAAGATLITPLSQAMDPDMRAAFASVGIPVRANYSSEEVGPIAYECERAPGSFHVATSNVIVEVIDEGQKLDGKVWGRVLVTGLHSYATPLIRYDLGDIACLDERCACGHDGPVLSNIYGRAKALLKHADGRISVFNPYAKELNAVAKFTDYRIRQVALDVIVVEIGGREQLTVEEVRGLEGVISAHAGPGFKVEIKPVAAIDWGPSLKRLGFRSEV